MHETHRGLQELFRQVVGVDSWQEILFNSSNWMISPLLWDSFHHDFGGGVLVL